MMTDRPAPDHPWRPWRTRREGEQHGHEREDQVPYAGARERRAGSPGSTATKRRPTCRRWCPVPGRTTAAERPETADTRTYQPGALRPSRAAPGPPRPAGALSSGCAVLHDDERVDAGRRIGPGAVR